MDDAGSTAPRDEAGPDSPAPPERSSGLILETCYRHSNVNTGVHCTRCGRPICPDCMRPAAVGYQCPECVAAAHAGYPRRRIRIQFYLGRPGIVTTTLLVVNIAMYALEVVIGGPGSLFGGPSSQKLYQLGAIYPPAVAGGQYWRLFTAMFLHGGLLHIGFNMYALYLFGYLIENAFGRVRYILIYFVSGFLASAASYVFMDPRAVGVGASGAIFGLLGAWVAYNYRRKNLAANRFQLQWAAFLIIINLILARVVPSIDNFAHIGGLMAGIVAGWVAEGVGTRQTRLIIAVAGFAALILAGVLLVTTRTATLMELTAL